MTKLLRGVLALSLLAGCATTVKVTRYVAPPKNDPGPPGPVFVEVEGTPAGVELVRPVLQATLRKMRFEPTAERTPKAAALTCHVERWQQTAVQPPQGNRPPPTTLTELMQAVMTWTRADGTVLTGDYSSSQQDFPRERAASANETLAATNVKNVLQQFVADFAPETATENVELDSDDASASGVNHAKAGDLAAAEAAFREVQTAAGHYDLGVVLEARGALESAAIEYDTAVRLAPSEPKYARAAEAVKKSAALGKR